MIKYCLEDVQCDPDVEVKDINLSNKADIEQYIEDNNDEQIDENIQPKFDISHEKTHSKPKETSIFSLLRTVPFADNTIKHPMEIFLNKTKNLNVLHHETRRTPLLEAINFQEYDIVKMLLNESSCDVNLSTSVIQTERQQTPLILACKLQSLPIVKELLNRKQCDLLRRDYQHNKAIHYFLSTPNRPSSYLDVLNLFVEKLKLTPNSLNSQGLWDRTPLHMAVLHNAGAIDSTTDVEELLIENGSDLLSKDKFGNIPLHCVFINKNIGDDPLELCLLVMKAMKYKSLDTENNEGNTALHLAVVSI